MGRVTASKATLTTLTPRATVESAAQATLEALAALEVILPNLKTFTAPLVMS